MKKKIAGTQKAVAYILITKLPEDSAYIVRRYDMHDTILFVGTFKDQQLAIPNGKFTYYNKKRLSKDKKTAAMDTLLDDQLNIAVDTNNYIQTTGYFLNGQKAGPWIEYKARGKKASEYTYENGKLNGLCKTYDLFSDSWSEFSMVNDSLQGKYNVYTSDSLLVSETLYDHNKVISQTVHLQQATENNNFGSYLEKKLRKYYNVLIKQAATIKYVVDKEGKILNPQIVKGINPEIDAALIAAILTAPNYTPATYDGAPIAQKILKHLHLYDMLRNR